MRSEDFEERVLRELGDLGSNVNGLRVEFQAYQEKTDSDIRELKGRSKKTEQSFTDLQMETIRAEAIVAKAKWDQVVKLGVAILKWIAVASLGGIGHVLWGIIHR